MRKYKTAIIDKWGNGEDLAQSCLSKNETMLPFLTK